MPPFAHRTLALLFAAVAASCSRTHDHPSSPYAADPTPREAWAAHTAPGTIHVEWQQPFAASGVTGYRVRYESAAQSARTFELGRDAQSLELAATDERQPSAILVSALYGGSESAPHIVLLGESRAGEHATSRTPAHIYSCGHRPEGLEVRWYSAPNEAGLLDFEVRWRMMGDASWSSQIVDPRLSDRGYELEGNTIRRTSIAIPDLIRPVFIEIVARYDDGSHAPRSMVWHQLARPGDRGTPPMPPVNTTVARVDQASVRVTWTRTPSTGPIDYRIYAYDCERFGEVVVSGVDAGTVGVVLRDLESGRHYNYYVHAIRHGVESDPEIGQLHE